MSGSTRVFFAFSTGLTGPIQAPKGTIDRIKTSIAHTEEVLGLVRTRYKDNSEHWGKPKWGDIDSETLCNEVSEHNRFVRWLYDRLSEWGKDPPADSETITPEDAASFWCGLEILTVPVECWTREYYRERMEVLYEVMRGRSAEGLDFGEKALTSKQAGAVIWLFSDMLDPGDLRLEVPRGCDHLASSYYGEYDWCERCGAIDDDDDSCRRRKCPVREIREG